MRFVSWKKGVEKGGGEGQRHDEGDEGARARVLDYSPGVAKSKDFGGIGGVHVLVEGVGVPLRQHEDSLHLGVDAVG